MTALDHYKHQHKHQLLLLRRDQDQDQEGQETTTNAAAKGTNDDTVAEAGAAGVAGAATAETAETAAAVAAAARTTTTTTATAEVVFALECSTAKARFNVEAHRSLEAVLLESLGRPLQALSAAKRGLGVDPLRNRQVIVVVVVSNGGDGLCDV